MPRHTVLTATGGRPDSFRLAMIGPIAYPSAVSSTSATDSASPRAASGPASKATPPNPMISPVHRTAVSRSWPPVSRARTAPMIGTAATSRPLVELDRRRSALASRANGPMSSVTAKVTSHAQ